MYHVKSWTRTLNLDDSHTLLALARPGVTQDQWVDRAHKALPHLSVARRREVIRLLRDGLIEWSADQRVKHGLFLDIYASASASAQVDLLHHAWAMSHPISLVAVEHVVAPRLEGMGDLEIPLQEVEALVRRFVETDSDESLRKTRTVLLGALEDIGTLVTRGTGQHRGLRAERGTPNPVTFGWLIRRELADRGVDSMMASEVPDTSLAARLTQCGPAHARTCVDWLLRDGSLVLSGDEIGTP